VKIAVVVAGILYLFAGLGAASTMAARPCRSGVTWPIVAAGLLWPVTIAVRVGIAAVHPGLAAEPLGCDELKADAPPEAGP